MNFWEHMPEDLYNSWKADEFISNAIPRLKQVVNSAPTPVLNVGNDAFSQFKRLAGGGVTSAVGGGFDALRTGYEKFTDSPPYQRYTEARHRVGGGLLYAISQPKAPAFQPIQKALGVDRPKALPSDFLQTREEASGFGKFAADVATDPLTYVGSYGKAAQGLGAGPRTVKAAELLDLKPLTTALERLGGRATTALAGTGRGLPTDAPNLLTRLGTGLTAASKRGTSSQAGEEIFDIARRLTSHADSQYGGRLGTSAFAEGGTPEVNRIRRWLSSPVGKFASEVDDKFGRQYGLDILNKAAKDAETPLEFAQKARDLIRTDYSQAYDASVAASRAGRGRLESFAKGIPEGIGSIYERSLAPVNRALSNYVLGTAMFPVGNVAEAGVRSASAGVAPRGASITEASRALADVPGVPSYLFEPGTRGGGSTARAFSGGAPSPGGWKDLLTGQAFLNASSKWTNPVERNFLMETYQRTGDVAATMEAFQKAFPTAMGTESNFARFAKAIMPFYGYESARWPYLARQALERPGAAATYAKYQENTDRGNIPTGLLPGFQVNPLRGSVFQGPSMLTKPQFPTYAQGKTGRIERATNLLGQAGFYPSPTINAAISLGRAIEGEPPEAGNLLPAALQVPLQVAQGATRVQLGPGGPYSGDITDRIPILGTLLNRVAEGATNLSNLMPDRFNDYYVNKELALMGKAPEDATAADRLEAEKRVAARMVFMTESNMLRFRPQEEQQYREDLKNAAIAAGVPKDIAEKNTANPISAKDASGQFILPAATRRQVYEQNPGFEKWRQVSEPLKRPAEQAINAATRDYHASLDDINKQTQDNLHRLYQGIQTGQISWKDARDLRSHIMADAASRRDMAKAQGQKKGALVDRQSQEAFYQKAGRDMPGQLPQDEAAQAYYDIQPQRDAVGRIDFETWTQQRQAVLNSMDPATRKYVLEDYPRKKYEGDPLVQAGEAEYKRRSDLMQQYFSIPQYRGLTSEQAQTLGQAAQLQSALRQMHPNWSPSRIMSSVRQQFPGVSQTQLQGRNRLRSDARQKFLAANPDLVAFLSDAILPGT